MEPTPVASSPQGTPSEPTESRTGSTADLSELLAKHASTVGNWASLVDEEAPVGQSEGPAGVWMGASQRASEPLDKPLNNNFREYKPPYRCYVSYIQNRAMESDIVHWFGGEQKVASIALHREGKILDCELELVDHDALLQALNLDGEEFAGRRIRVEYIGQGPPRKFSKPGGFSQQQQGGYRGPPNQNDFRGVGRQHQYGQYQREGQYQRDGDQRQRQQPQQQSRNKPFVPRQEVNDVRALQNRGDFVQPPLRPPPQISPPPASAEHPKEQFKPPSAVPAPAPAPPAKPRVNPFGAATAVDTTKRMAEMEAKMLAERQAKEKEAKERAAAQSHAASGATSPSSSEPPALDHVHLPAGSIRIMKREDRVSEDSGVPRNESHLSLDGNSERASDVSRKTSSSSSVAHDQQRQFTRPSQPPHKYSGPAHTNTRDKKFVEKPQRIDSRRSTAERSDKSQTTRPPRPHQQPHPDGQRPRQQHGPPYGQKGGGRQAHEVRGGTRGVQKTDTDDSTPVTNKPTDDRRPSLTKANETDVKAATDVAKEPDATPFTNGKPDQPTQPVAEAKPSDHSVAPKKQPLTFTNSSRKASHGSSNAPPTPAADAAKQLPNGQAQGAASSVEQPPAPKADTGSSKKKKEKKAKAKEASITSKNKFGALLDCDVYD